MVNLSKRKSVDFHTMMIFKRGLYYGELKKSSYYHFENMEFINVIIVYKSRDDKLTCEELHKFPFKIC